MSDQSHYTRAYYLPTEAEERENLEFVERLKKDIAKQKGDKMKKNITMTKADYDLLIAQKETSENAVSKLLKQLGDTEDKYIKVIAELAVTAKCSEDKDAQIEALSSELAASRLDVARAHSENEVVKGDSNLTAVLNLALNKRLALSLTAQPEALHTILSSVLANYGVNAAYAMASCHCLCASKSDNPLNDTLAAIRILAEAGVHLISSANAKFLDLKNDTEWTLAG